ncbi:hypothetical protein ACM25O_20420 [Sulfitobacter pontiacus]|jgi:DNA-binding cell septation regulator SpoVG
MSDDTQMMTYADAAKKLGIKVDSVRRRARNRGWHRIRGNDGLTLVAVPVSLIPDNPKDISEDINRDVRRDIPDNDLAIANAVLETENRMLRDAVEDLKADRDAWRQMAERRRSWWPFTR